MNTDEHGWSVAGLAVSLLETIVTRNRSSKILQKHLCSSVFICGSPALLRASDPAGADALREDVEQAHGVVPADTRVGDGDAALERLPRHQVLAAGIEVALDHHAHDAV